MKKAVVVATESAIEKTTALADAVTAAAVQTDLRNDIGPARIEVGKWRTLCDLGFRKWRTHHPREVEAEPLPTAVCEFATRGQTTAYSTTSFRKILVWDFHKILFWHLRCYFFSFSEHFSSFLLFW